MPRRLLLAVVIAALSASGCLSGPPPASPPPVLQVIDDRGPATVGPSVLAASSVSELSALIKGAGGDCSGACWDHPSDASSAYVALIATAPCVNRDLAASVSGPSLLVSITWKPVDCRGVAAQSALGYSLFSVRRQLLPAGVDRISVRYAGVQPRYQVPTPGSTAADLSQPPDPAREESAVAIAIEAARVDAGIPPRSAQLRSLYRLQCRSGQDSYVVSLLPSTGGQLFTGQYVGGRLAQPAEGCPGP